jgi:hypothetical protein
MKSLFKNVVHRHRPSKLPSIILFASPRGGSTWITELIASQPKFWPISEPLNVRAVFVEKQLGVSKHSELYSKDALPKIEAYYSKILNGQYSDLKMRPGLQFYRPVTDRIVIKENQACLNRIAWFENTFEVKVIHLLRHPIPVALSREVFPFFDGFESCGLRQHFSEEQLALADSIIESGTHLDKGVIAWCLHHVPALRATRSSWITLTYEETVLFPERVIAVLANRLSLPDEGMMLAQVRKPSQVARKSNVETQKLLDVGENRENLVDKWKSKVTATEMESVQLILDVFEVKQYRASEVLPIWGELKL